MDETYKRGEYRENILNDINGNQFSNIYGYLIRFITWTTSKTKNNLYLVFLNSTQNNFN